MQSSKVFYLSVGGRSNQICENETRTFQKGDVIGCILDLNAPSISFTLNGIKVKGCFKNFNLDGMFFPVISISAKLR